MVLLLNEKKNKPKCNRYPLGLPSGSVRALLTLLVLLVVAVQMLSGEEMSPLWVETLLITLAHYFTSRRFINLPTELVPDLEKAGHLEPETNPLYLPRHSIRIVIVATFFFVGISLLYLNRMNQNSWVILLAVIPYLIGILFKAARLWLLDKLDRVPTIWWSDLKAILVLGLMAAATFLYLWGTPLMEPWDDMTLVAVLFYFGSR